MIYDKHAAAAFAVTAVRDWSLGYSQGDERTDIRDGGSADCSSLVAAAVNAGYGNAAAWAPLPATSWTGTLRAALTALGWRTLPPQFPALGDVLLAEGSHVAMAVADDGTLAEAWIDENDDIVGGRPGDQTGQETRLKNYAEHPDTLMGAWTHLLRPPATQAAPTTRAAAPTAPAASAGKPGPLLGVDISNYQAGISLAAVNPDFTIVMASQGDWFTNQCFVAQVQASLDLGKPTGVYHYVDGSGVQAELEHFLAVVNGAGGDVAGRVFWCVDWEARDNSAWGDETYLQRFIEALKARTGRRVLLYASSGDYPDAVQDATGCARWVAQYADSEATGWDASPWTDGSWSADMHQYTGTGRVPGYGADLDLDVYYGSEADLRALAGSGSTTSPRGGEEENDVFTIIKSPNRDHAIIAPGVYLRLEREEELLVALAVLPIRLRDRINDREYDVAVDMILRSTLDATRTEALLEKLQARLNA